jgi:hypothetical protein
MIDQSDTHLETNGSEVLLEAHRLVNVDRNLSYGHPADDYATVRDIFEALTGVKLTVDQAIMYPLAMKLARIRTNLDKGVLHRDSVIDGCGYLACLAMIHARGVDPLK